MTAKTQVTRSISGVGVGPDIQELVKFANSVKATVGRVTIEKIPRDRPFDPEGWSMSVTYTEEETNG